MYILASNTSAGVFIKASHEQCVSYAYNIIRLIHGKVGMELVVELRVEKFREIRGS